MPRNLHASALARGGQQLLGLLVLFACAGQPGRCQAEIAIAGACQISLLDDDTFGVIVSTRVDKD